jgi:hypothetical protein
VGAWSILGCLGAEAVAETTTTTTTLPPTKHRMQKAICLSNGGLEPGFPPQKDPNSPDAWGNDCILADLQPRYVRIFVPWRHMQPTAPANRSAARAQLLNWVTNVRPDFEPRIQKAGGRTSAILVVYHEFPPWTNTPPTPPSASCRPAITQKEKDRPASRLPCDLSGTGEYSKSFNGSGKYADSPWGWFIEWLMERYKDKVAGIEILNEPNFLMWPLDQDFPRRVAFMMTAATELACRTGFPGAIYAPAISDETSYLTRTRKILAAFKSMPSFYRHPRVGACPSGDRVCRCATEKGNKRINIKWSHHNYKDINKGKGKAKSVKNMLKLLACTTKKVSPYLYLTEGGAYYPELGNDATQAAQAALKRLSDNWKSTRDTKVKEGGQCPTPTTNNHSQRRRMRATRVKLWTHYQINSTCRPTTPAKSVTANKSNQTGFYDSFIFGNDPALSGQCGCPGGVQQCPPDGIFPPCRTCSVCNTARPAGRGKQRNAYSWFKTLSGGRLWAQSCSPPIGAGAPCQFP